jgi:mannose-6-phosphate isomerase-like protein (cupin superfamily)
MGAHRENDLSREILLHSAVTKFVRFGAIRLSRSMHENESVYIPIGSVHRMANKGKIPLELIEVQTGSYLGEEDIDVYKRG